MPGYSSDQFRKDWVYACDQDFKSPNGSPATWAPGQPAVWGDENAKIPLPSDPSAASLNADGTLLAVALEHDINIYTISNLKLYQVLKGHISRIDALRFHPEQPNTLVSCAMNHHGRSRKAEPAIFFWDLKQQMPTVDTEVNVKTLAEQDVQGVVSGLRGPQSALIPTEKERAAVVQDFEKPIDIMIAKALVRLRENRQILGRLVSGRDSHVFNRDGTSMVYLPGPRPMSNSVDDWDICIWDTAKAETRLTLKGHTDAIRWTGFSPDDRLIGSVSWDETFRIWNNETGGLLHIFTSKHQNWTGGFSPNSRYFAGTSGNGRFWVWDMVDGSEVVTHEFVGWHRTLDWSPDGKKIVIGGRNLGHLVVFDIEEKRAVQERLLSMKNCPEELRRSYGGFLEVTLAQYLPGGRKIAFRTSGDSGLEVYDQVDNIKWRFAPKEGESKGYSWSFVFLPKDGLIASVDGDAIRLWELPPYEGDQWVQPKYPNSRRT